MNYVNFTAGTHEYKLKLSTRNVVMLEKSLGCNPLAIFGDGTQLPTITMMVAILHASLQQLNHGITLNDAYGIFDDYLNDGHAITDFINVILDIYKVSGIMREEEQETEKN